MSKAKMMGAAFAAMLSMAGVKKAEAHPHHDHNHDAPTTSVQATRYEQMARTTAEARPDIDVLFLDFDAYVSVNPDAKSEAAADYYMLDRRRILNAVQSLLPEGDVHMRLPREVSRKQERVSAPSEMVANEITNAYMALAGKTIDSAVARHLEFQDDNGRKIHACIASSTNAMTADEVVSTFGNMNINAGDIPLEKLYDVIAKHELGHCLTPEVLDVGRSAGEGIADVFALAHHVQKHGADDGFSQYWREIRAVSAVNRGTNTDYNITPIIDAAMPHILQAHASGELANMDVVALLEKSKQWSFGETPREQTRRLRQFQSEGRAFNKALDEIYEKGSFHADTAQYEPREGLNDLSPQALAVLGSYEQSRQVVAENSIDLTADAAISRYREQLTELLDMKTGSASKIQTLRQRQVEVNASFERLANGYNGNLEGYQNAIREQGAGGLSLLDEHRALADVERTLAGHVEPAAMEHAPLQTAEANLDKDISR